MSAVIDQGPVVSVVTQIEVLGYKVIPEDELILNEFINVAQIIGLSEDIVRHKIELRRAYKIKTPDAIIAATSQVLNLTLISRNTKDFDKIKDLKIIDPHSKS